MKEIGEKMGNSRFKFRAWHEQGKEIIYFKNEKLVNDQYQMQSLAHLINGDYGDVLMQYTGLKDKNGVEIYEGDIVVMHTEWSGGHCSDDFEEFETKGVVRIQSSKGTVITKAKKRDLIECDGKWLKTWDVNLRACRTVVIGNIYENPELLGE